LGQSVAFGQCDSLDDAIVVLKVGGLERLESQRELEVVDKHEVQLVVGIVEIDHVGDECGRRVGGHVQLGVEDTRGFLFEHAQKLIRI